MHAHMHAYTHTEIYINKFALYERIRFICVCVYACTYACTYTHTERYIIRFALYERIRFTCVCVYACAYACTYTHTEIYINRFALYERIRFTCVCVYACTYACTYTHTERYVYRYMGTLYYMYMAPGASAYPKRRKGRSCLRLTQTKRKSPFLFEVTRFHLFRLLSRSRFKSYVQRKTNVFVTCSICVSETAEGSLLSPTSCIAWCKSATAHFIYMARLWWFQLLPVVVVVIVVVVVVIVAAAAAAAAAAVIIAVVEVEVVVVVDVVVVVVSSYAP